MTVLFRDTFDTNPTLGPLGTGDASPDLTWTEFTTGSLLVQAPGAITNASDGCLVYGLPSNVSLTGSIYTVTQRSTAASVERGISLIIDGSKLLSLQSATPQQISIISHFDSATLNFYNFIMLSTATFGRFQFRVQRVEAGTAVTDVLVAQPSFAPGTGKAIVLQMALKVDIAGSATVTGEVSVDGVNPLGSNSFIDGSPLSATDDAGIFAALGGTTFDNEDMFEIHEWLDGVNLLADQDFTVYNDDLLTEGGSNLLQRRGLYLPTTQLRF